MSRSIPTEDSVGPTTCGYCFQPKTITTSNCN